MDKQLNSHIFVAIMRYSTIKCVPDYNSKDRVKIAFLNMVVCTLCSRRVKCEDESSNV